MRRFGVTDGLGCFDGPMGLKISLSQEFIAEKQWYRGQRFSGRFVFQKKQRLL